MKNALVLFGALLTLALGADAQASPQGTKGTIATRTFLLGTWSCHHTVGTFSGDYATTWSLALGNLWLKQTYDFPKSSEAPAIHAEYFMGYDERRQGWVRFGAHSNGQYFAIRMADDGKDGWYWKYVSFFPPRRPASTKPDAHFVRDSDRQYEIFGPTYPLNGTGPVVTEHHICKKA